MQIAGILTTQGQSTTDHPDVEAEDRIIRVSREQIRRSIHRPRSTIGSRDRSRNGVFDCHILDKSRLQFSEINQACIDAGKIRIIHEQMGKLDCPADIRPGNRPYHCLLRFDRFTPTRREKRNRRRHVVAATNIPSLIMPAWGSELNEAGYLSV